MKSVVKGKVVKETYYIMENTKTILVDGEYKTVFTGKPRLQKDNSISEWKDILTVNGKIHYNEDDSVFGFNISKDETVYVNKSTYRADLDEIHVFTDKVVQTIEEYKEESEERLKELLADFNEQMINSNEAMLAYCKLHKLEPREADCEQVFKLVYSGKKYKIVDGAMIVIDKTSFDTSELDRALAECRSYVSTSVLGSMTNMISNSRK